METAQLWVKSALPGSISPQVRLPSRFAAPVDEVDAPSDL